MRINLALCQRFAKTELNPNKGAQMEGEPGSFGRVHGLGGQLKGLWQRSRKVAFTLLGIGGRSRINLSCVPELLMALPMPHKFATEATPIVQIDELRSEG
jgi:hypothetical protein